MLRDPVLVLPVVVAGGLAVGGLGVHEQVAGTRIDRRPGAVRGLWRRPRSSCWSDRAGVERVGCSLRPPSQSWAQTSSGRRSQRALDARVPAGGAVGRLSGSARAHLPGRAVLVAHGPVRDRLRLRSDARRAARRRVRRPGRTRPAVRLDAGRASPTRSTECRRSPALPSLWSCSSSSCGGCGPLRGAARRSQGPLLAAAAATILVGLVWLGWVIATDAQHGEARDDRERRCRVAPGRGRGGDPLVAPSSSGSVRARRRAANADGGDDARAARAGARRPHARGCLPARQRPLRRRGGPPGRACRATATVPSRR